MKGMLPSSCPRQPSQALLPAVVGGAEHVVREVATGGEWGRRFLEETDLCLLGKSGDGVVENCPCRLKTSYKSAGP